MKKIRLFENPLSKNQVKLGGRLLIASIFLMVGKSLGGQLMFAAVVMAGIAMVFPAFGNYKSFTGKLMTGEQEEAALLEKIKKQNETQLADIRKEFADIAKNAKAGMLSEEAFNKKLEEITEKLGKIDPTLLKTLVDKIEKYEKRIEDQQKALLEQGEALKKLQDGGAAKLGEKGVSPLRAELKRIMSTDEYKAFVDSNGKQKCSFEISKAVSITSDYTGDSQVHITTRDTTIVDHPVVKRLNVRDLLRVAPTDLPYLAFMEVYEWNRATAMKGENDTLPESSFKLREATAQVKRLGTFVDISKRMLKSVPFVESHLVQMLPAQVRYYEDFQLLFGNGEGNNLTGIFTVADDFATIINTALEGAAGSVASIAAYGDDNSKTLVTFTANQNINNGDIITFAAGAGANYAQDHVALVVSPRQIVIAKNYVAEATADWTFSVESRFKNSVSAAQQIDVLKIAKTLVTRQEYSCTGIVLHPDDATAIELLKGNDEHYLDVKRLESGIMTIAGVPVVETTAMPSGKFAVGDWALACALYEFSSLKLEFAEDNTSKKTNTVSAIISEEVLFPIYNQYMFVVGEFNTGILAISAESES
jgi:HK97 family phage major capsid protein